MATNVPQRTDDEEDEDEEPTIIQSMVESNNPWESEVTHTEDTIDYVNVAPWQRRRPSTTPPPLAAFDLQMIKMATENAKWVKTEGKCQVPQRRCEMVTSEQHPPGSVFWPHCALLHRCDEGTGCCLAHKTCSPADTENVQMYFYVFGGQRAKIEMMTFVNHTRCSCQLRTSSSGNGGGRSCRCPQHFTPTSINGKCTCDCHTGSRCRRYKRGRRTLSQGDVNCITTKECTEPQCEYGPFLSNHRRCTKRRERDQYTTVRK
ncbi:hypothetical protein Pmani_018249 [Petrolisthes manimaculis]|uniref:Platelet-derived growth factor (PDGF) family profile domain-containing protein n=1 Tax=Petrolisthes manimaculis TaxID=1843537 RepID=A0AAE1U6V5_9EUCA|nr:hypothetical protein Pmani_018249 [Petrolisthes manimaculis]